MVHGTKALFFFTKIANIATYRIVNYATLWQEDYRMATYMYHQAKHLKAQGGAVITKI